MARIPQQEIDRLKEEVSVQRLVEDSGVVLRKGGKDLMGLCPYHADKSASLVVSPKKNLWNCFGCGIGGGAIDWVMKQRGLSFRQAVEVLQAEVGSGVKPQTAAQPAAASPSSLAAAAAVVVDTAQDAADQTLLAQTIDYYHQRLKDTATQPGSAVAYLASRGLTHPGLVDAFWLGVADRTLGLRVGQGWPLSAGQFSRKTINATRASLQRLGLIRQTGHEHFNGSLVIPLFDEAGPGGAMGQSVVEVYGRKLRDDLKQDNTQYGSKHLYLRNTHDDADAKRYRGVFNLAGVQAAGQHHNVDALPGNNRGEVILCEALLDAMTFWCAGFTQVTSSFGAGGFTDDILQALKVNGIERVFIAYDRDEAGDKGADKLAPLLIEEGFEVLRVVFPKGMDANEYAQKMQPADKALALVLRQAVWIGGVRKIEEQPAAKKKISPADEAVQAAAVDGALETSSLAASAPQAQSQGMQALPAAETVEQPDELHMDTGGITWRVRGWKKTPAPRP